MRSAAILGILAIFVAASVSAQTIYSSAGKIITYYVPHNAPNCKTSIEGCIETSRPGLDGIRKPACLDAVRLGKAKYVTVASDSSNYGKYYHLGTITYRSALDSQMYTMKDVIGYVHDTGGAFRGRPDKLDICTTVCPGCSDSQAGALAQGKNVAIDPNNLGERDPNNTPTYTSNPYSPFSVTPFSGTNASAGYGATPVSTLLGAQSPLGVGGSSNTGSSGSGTTASTEEVVGTLSASTIIVQPRNAHAGAALLVSWTSVNMKPSQCSVSKNGEEFATGNEATKRDILEASVEYVLTCTTPSGETATSKAVINL